MALSRISAATAWWLGNVGGPSVQSQLIDKTNAVMDAVDPLTGRYSRTMSFSKSVPDSAYTVISSFTSIVENNAPATSPFSSGIFTAPQDGLYSIYGYTGGVTGAARTTVRLRINGTEICGADNTSAGGAGRSAASLTWWVNTGDTIEWSLYQNSGGTVTMTGFASIAQIG